MDFVIGGTAEMLRKTGSDVCIALVDELYSYTLCLQVTI